LKKRKESVKKSWWKVKAFVDSAEKACFRPERKDKNFYKLQEKNDKVNSYPGLRPGLFTLFDQQYISRTLSSPVYLFGSV